MSLFIVRIEVKGNGRVPSYNYTVLQSQKAVSAYFPSEQILLLDFADQNSCKLAPS